MKKLLSICLAASLLSVAGTPAFAASAAPIPAVEGPSADDASGSLDARLTAVTQAVKSQLAIGDDFTTFYGEPNDSQLAPRWDLNWSSDGSNISVTADENGKIYAYRLYQTDEDNQRFWGLTAAFPKSDKATALAAAQKFVDSLLDEQESVTLESAGSSQSDGLTFSGSLKFYGLPSPVTVRVQLRSDTLSPSYFRRSDSNASTYPEVAEAKSAVSAEQAAALMRPTIQLAPYYAYSKDRKSAELRYMVETEGDYVVTADDGKLVDLTKVFSELARAYSSTNGSAKSTFQAYAEDAAASAEAGESGGTQAALSGAELEAVERLKDVHSREQLDKALRSIPELGLDSAWTLERANYSQDRESDKITAVLRYTRPLTEAEREQAGDGYDGELLQLRKNVTVDARTDELVSVYSYNPYWDDPQTEQTASQRAAAEAFLAKYLPEKWEQSTSYEMKNSDRLLYAQTVNGYQFRSNQISIRMANDNTVEWLSAGWDEQVKFDSADGIIPADEAVSACFDAFDMALRYIEYPVLEDSMLAYRYVAAYAFQEPSDRTFQGINAKTGEPVWYSYSDDASPYTYNDLDGAFGRSQIEALAAYGVGLPGEGFRPKATLDQKTMLTLLLSACGYQYDPDEKEGLDNLYSMAYAENLVKAVDRAPEQAVDRLTFIKTLLGASIYGEAAKVEGIYTCPFSDAGAIAKADTGYAALAYGLGVARGDDKGRLNPDSVMTRQEAAVMLYNFMMR